MKKILAIVIALTMLVVFAAPAWALALPGTVDLDAGRQKIDVGDVAMSKSGTTLTVTVTTHGLTAPDAGDLGWYITKVQAESAVTLTGTNGIPQNKNNAPRPSQFEYQQTFTTASGTTSHTFTLPITGSSPDYVAVHVEVAWYDASWGGGAGMWFYEGAWADGTEFGSKNHAEYVIVTW
jgi:hypothetical protein